MAWAFAGALGGAAFPFLVYAALWGATSPDPTWDGLGEKLRDKAVHDTVFSWALVLSALLGFIVVGEAKGNVVASKLGRAFGLVALASFSGIVGALVGIITYVLVWTASNPDATVAESARSVPGALREAYSPIHAFLVGGALMGVSFTVFLRATDFLRGVARNVAGAVFGGVAGLVLYALAYMLIHYPELPRSAAYVVYVAEAIYSFSIVEFGIIALGATVGVITSRYSWRFYGIFTLTSLLAVVIGYVLYTVNLTLPRVPPDRLWLSLVLFGAEVVSLTMVVLYSFYTIDVATRKRWRRTPRSAAFSQYYVPRVALHVPTFNEPPELVIASLKTILALDYPEDRFLIMVGDDSTRPERAKPLEEFCTATGIGYYHRDERAGFKAGALNYLLERTPEDVDLIAVVDADYQVDPTFLAEIAGYFIDEDLGWLQTPQDYRNEDESFLTKQYYLADKYFYRTVLPSRNEENSIIFCGTMGVLRRQALLEVGGWGEDYITEDAELSVRLLTARWKSLYVNKTYGRGLIPATFEGYKKQHARWALGGGQVLRGHFLDIFFGRFTPRQRFDYIVGNMHWFEGLFVLLIAGVLLYMGIGDLAGGTALTHHSNEIFLIGLVPFFLLMDGFTRLHMVLRRSLRVTFGGTVRVLGMWFAVKFSNSRAALKGLLGFRMAFQRTSKSTPNRLGTFAAIKYAIRTTPLESIVAGLCLVTGSLLLVKSSWLSGGTGSQFFTRLFLSFWLLYYSLMFGSAPIYAFRAQTSLSPGEARPSLASQIKSVA